VLALCFAEPCGAAPCPAGYVRLISFSQHSPDDMLHAINQLKVCRV
jgi:hypothetical protein